jgi:hypothetical protein
LGGEGESLAGGLLAGGTSQSAVEGEGSVLPADVHADTVMGPYFAEAESGADARQNSTSASDRQESASKSSRRRAEAYDSLAEQEAVAGVAETCGAGAVRRAGAGVSGHGLNDDESWDLLVDELAVDVQAFWQSQL